MDKWATFTYSEQHPMPLYRLSQVPEVFKSVYIRDPLKKSSLDPDVLRNYRSVSNLPFIVIVLDKVIDARLEKHLHSNNLHEWHQSAYLEDALHRSVSQKGTEWHNWVIWSRSYGNGGCTGRLSFWMTKCSFAYLKGDFGSLGVH